MLESVVTIYTTEFVSEMNVIYDIEASLIIATNTE